MLKLGQKFKTIEIVTVLYYRMQHNAVLRDDWIGAFNPYIQAISLQ
jgi:hypothetical protein